MNQVKTERTQRIQSKLLEKAKNLPQKPGCYLMKDNKGKVLYVGKAKKLKNRVSSYFQSSAKSPKTEILVSHIRDFDFLLADNESEAFILENNLIKKYSPKYNIMLRDDKSYPYVVVDYSEPFPRLLYQRRVKRSSDKKVFGPFAHGSNLGEILRILRKSFELRDCSLREFRARKEPCLLYQIKQCSAPCVEYINEKDYQEDLDHALKFFEGQSDESLAILENKMLEASENEEFERAALLRDQIKTLRDFCDYSQQKNAEIQSKEKDVDVIAYFEGEFEVDVAIYMLRNGLLLGHKNFHFPLIDFEDDIETELSKFVLQYYSSTYDSLPRVIVSSFSSATRKLIQDAFQSFSEMKMKTAGKDFKSLLKLAHEQAQENQRFRFSNNESEYMGLNKLKDLLSLSERPITLECYDIAIFQGASPTASQIVFVNGQPDKKKYKYYHLKERAEGNNDFAMMKEVISRRLKHGELPDVFIVDGGKGQVSSFKAALDEADIKVPVIGIAKSKAQSNFSSSEVKKSEERLILPNRSNPYILNKNKALLKIIVSMRDEAHRFSRKLHHKKETERTFQSWLDHVEGIGPKRKKELLKKMTKSVEELSKLNLEELKKEFGVSKKLAEKMRLVLMDKKES